MTDKEQWELEQVKAQTALALKQAKTEFWKVGILLVGVTAAVVQTLNVWLR
jgi:hypothetical protein